MVRNKLCGYLCLLMLLVLTSDNEFRYHECMLTQDFFRGFIKLHILHHASKEAIYGVWIIEELNRHGYKLSPGTLYPILHSLEEEKLLTSRSETVEGKIRKYYEITDEGKKRLEESKLKVKELVDELYQ